DATLSLTLLDDADIAALNGEYLDRDGPTDVIAFALHDPGESPLGDVYVGV
ncbi:MAG: rRNA maturation RNase YbeY, partial [Gemmatimonadetes bacterium]|nr:rRNA maturation RNase YbeY [Gemmatimonadota bacterium]NIQ53196.1 rRNA maturation RNase YbeY [Gemmatimonadota bacterium]NIU73344.1 rRNA maturation RNase YbeY [Gammaproteobacteria bacterium]NIX43577.1 rRNA maturation RNase YbeY [Gemmatimonadota bacterium]